MKIALTSQGETLDAPCDPRFGRCRYFIIVDEESGEVRAYDNPSLSSGGGAGIQAA
ncbi:MAG: NifB/NifX family molybdenum-iron cluster-binding protein, partial [bacterium]